MGRYLMERGHWSVVMPLVVDMKLSSLLNQMVIQIMNGEPKSGSRQIGPPTVGPRGPWFKISFYDNITNWPEKPDQRKPSQLKQSDDQLRTHHTSIPKAPGPGGITGVDSNLDPGICDNKILGCFRDFGIACQGFQRFFKYIPQKLVIFLW